MIPPEFDRLGSLGLKPVHESVPQHRPPTPERNRRRYEAMSCVRVCHASLTGDSRCTVGRVRVYSPGTERKSGLFFS